jgi:exodeoxyribonuclease III
MLFLSLNCNGIRSAFKKGLDDFLIKENPDICCFQEIKAIEKEIDLDFFHSMGYKHTILPATKKGYSGTAIFTKQKSFEEIVKFHDPIFYEEGRVILHKYKKFYLVNAYFPSGTSGDDRQNVKMSFLNSIEKVLIDLQKEKKPIILCGDVNIAHTEIDIHDPKSNAKNSGFLPEEREWVSKFLEKGWVDSFRSFHPSNTGDYSWWTYRFNAKLKNKGWRIDYFFVTQDLKSKITSAGIHNNQNFSDHAPIYLKIDI